jgi:hypothetical protein
LKVSAIASRRKLHSLKASRITACGKLRHSKGTALQAVEEFDTEGGGGFNPRITPAESTPALAAEGLFASISPEIQSFLAACLAAEGMKVRENSLPHDHTLTPATP